MNKNICLTYMCIIIAKEEPHIKVSLFDFSIWLSITIYLATWLSVAKFKKIAIVSIKQKVAKKYNSMYNDCVNSYDNIHYMCKEYIRDFERMELYG